MASLSANTSDDDDNNNGDKQPLITNNGSSFITASNSNISTGEVASSHKKKIIRRPRKKKKLKHDNHRDSSNDDDDNKDIIYMKSPLPNLVTNFHDLASKHADFLKEWQLLKQRQQQQRPFQKNRKRGRSNKHYSEAVPNDEEDNEHIFSFSSSFSSNVDFNFNLALTRATLKSTFDLNLPCMPEGKLCPPVPNRANYVAWLQSLVQQSCSKHYFDLTDLEDGKERTMVQQLQEDEEKENHEKKNGTTNSKYLHCQGIDIGTGASCIYPLLLSTSIFINNGNSDDQKDSPKWRFAATDIDPESVRCAKENVDANKLQNRIHVLLVEPSTTQQRDFNMSCNNDGQNASDDDDTDVSVKICNESFEMKNEKAKTAADDKVLQQEGTSSFCGPIYAAIKATNNLDIFQRKWGHPIETSPSSSCFDFVMTNPPFYETQSDASKPRQGDKRARTDMTKSESVYPGGEVGFVSDMMRDSATLKDRITWYTSMVGKKSTLMQLLRFLREAGFGTGSVRTTEFVQGKQIRWGIAWTYRKVAVRSLATKVTGRLQQFEVTLMDTREKEEPEPGPVDEVVGRIRSYCASFKDAPLKCILQTNTQSLRNEKESGAAKNVSMSVDGQVVTICQSSYDPDDRDTNLIASGAHLILNPFPQGQPVNLPKEGHFLIDAYIRVKETVSLQNDSAGGCGGDDGAKQEERVIVQLKSYCHSLVGLEKIRFIHDQIEGEIGRTNRRWRRILARQNR